MVSLFPKGHFHTSPSEAIIYERNKNVKENLTGRLARNVSGGGAAFPHRTAAFFPSHLVTQTEQAMSPVTFRQVRPMSKIRSMAQIRPM